MGLSAPHGLVLGKFMPVHRGHQYLLDFARSWTCDLTVVVGSLGSEPIPGTLRVQWLEELYGDLKILHLTDENPQLPHEHPDFWAIWQRSLQRLVNRPIDLLFASEDYGAQLAQVLGARFVPANGGRGIFAVSGTSVRDDPQNYWNDLPPCVQEHYTKRDQAHTPSTMEFAPASAKRVLLFGPESTGKTTLAHWLADQYNGLVVPEYARTFLRGREDDFDLEDMTFIAQGQRASEEALARCGRSLLFCDTDPLTTAIWSEELFGEIRPEVEEAARSAPYDLTLLLDVDVPWVEGSLRLRPADRRRFFHRCREALEQQNRPFVTISGSWDTRREQAVRAMATYFPSYRPSNGLTEQEESRK